MAKAPKQEQKPAPAPEPSTVPPGPPKSYRLQITLGFVCLILFEMFVLWMVLPAKQTPMPNIGTNPIEGSSGFDSPPLVPTDIGTKKPEEERSIGTKEFKVTKTLDGDTTSFVVTIRVTILTADKKKFDKLYPAYENRICDRITSILEATTDAERTEPGYTAMKAKIMKGINEVIEQQLVRSVLFLAPAYTKD